MTPPYVTGTAGILAVLSSVCAVFFWLEKATGWRLFQYMPPLVFIYATPILLTNLQVLPLESAVYESIESLLLPMMLTLLLLNVNFSGALRIMGRGVGVMLFGSLGVMIGAPLGLLVVRRWLGPDAWMAYGALAGSWIGGTGNLMAVNQMLDAPGAEGGLAVLADSTLYSLWLPVLLISKRFATSFARFTGVESDRVEQLRAIAIAERHEPRVPTTRDYLFLVCITLVATWVANSLASVLPVKEPFLSVNTWKILLITSLGIALSFTPMRRIPGSQDLGMAFVFLFVAKMGATADLSSVAKQAIPFLAGAFIMISTHGLFCLIGAKLFRSDIHTAAIASAANIGGAASASIVASHHLPALVPSAILMALIGYAIGTYCGYLTALLCRMLM
ncbi:MAG: DUF819 family protein [Pirellulales bacterium]|nr:DUF819 family protein [Pirellulales bacterium]